MASNERLLGIQFCRGIAASLVVLYHAGRILAQPQYIGHLAFAGAFNFGNAGVDFFFVLSGFIIFFVHEKDIGRPSSLRSYVWSRLTRIYPIYWLVTAIAMALLIGKHDTSSFGPAYLVASLFLLPQPQEPILQVGWTLVHEMLFYAAFAIAIVSRNGARAIAAIWLASVVLSAFITVKNPLLRVFLSPYHVQFAMGVMTAYAVRKWPLPFCGFAIAVGAAAFVGAAYVLDHDPGFYATPTCRWLLGLASSFVIYGVARGEMDGWLRTGPISAFFGSASYSIYLIHAIAIGLIARTLAPSGAMTAAPNGAFLLIALLAIICGALLYVVAERPMLRLAKAFGQGRRATPRA
jgi:exopolysaccharide production protein ExoZ